MITEEQTLATELKHELLHIAETVVETTDGNYLFQEGQAAKEIYLILSGRIQISKNDLHGKELILRICSKDELIGELTLFTAKPKYLLNAKVLESGKVAVINKDVLEKMLSQNPTLSYALMKWMSDHFRRTQTKLHDLVLYGKKGALFSTLIRLCNSYGVSTHEGILIDIWITNDQLASLCGSTRETVNRMLHDLEKNGVLSMHGKKILIHDLEIMRREVNCENCPIDNCSIE